MAKQKRIRRVGSIRDELVQKSREAALSAVQAFNNPSARFKTETFIVLMIIAWTYLLHAYYRKTGVEYRYFKDEGNRRRFDRTKRGAYKYWELERCLRDAKSPVPPEVTANLLFLIGLRHEIEHQMTTRLDELISARLQSCCINYNECLKNMFGGKLGIENHLSFSLQFSSLSEDQVEQLSEAPGLPKHIQSYIAEFDATVPDAHYNSAMFAYRVMYVPKLTNSKGQADKVIEFVKADSELAKSLNAQIVVLKETERPKYLPRDIVAKMHDDGFPKFNMHHHTTLWQGKNARQANKGFGVQIAKCWYWYERWVDEVTAHCKANADVYQ